MTNDEILQAAKESELYLDGVNQSMPLYVMKTEDLQRFAAIIEKRAIERCAHIAEQGPDQCEWTDEADYDTGLWNGYLSAAAAIRKLGEQE